MDGTPARRAETQPTLEQRVARALTQARRDGVDITTHRRAIERRLDAMTRRIADRDADPSRMA